MTSQAAETDDFYALLDDLAKRIGGVKRLSDAGLARQCPKAGLYFFLEEGEVRCPNGRPRVVRVGTHALTATSKTTLWGRLRQHMGRTSGSNPGGGNHRGSIFRRHVGSALLNQRNNKHLLNSWMAPYPHPDQLSAERELEVQVSHVIRAMPFLWLSVPTHSDGTSDRGLLERNLIALLSTLAGGTDDASSTWLGRYASASKVRQSSLWNVNHVGDRFDPGTLEVLRSYVGAMT